MLGQSSLHIQRYHNNMMLAFNGYGFMNGSSDFKFMYLLNQRFGNREAKQFQFFAVWSSASKHFS